MAKRKLSKPKVEYNYISVKLSETSSTISAGINWKIHDRRYAEDSTPIYRFDSDLELSGSITYPDERAGNEFKLLVYGRELHDGQFQATLEDYHVRDAQGVRKYRKRGDQHVPVYDPPDSIGHIEKLRGTLNWSGCVWVSPTTINDMLSLICIKQQLYFCIDEVKESRRRFIRGITLQTTDPNEE